MDYDKEKFYNISTEKEFREFMKKADEVDTRDAIDANCATDRTVLRSKTDAEQSERTL